MQTKTCPFCKTERPIEKFEKTRAGGRVKKCGICKYQDTKKIKTPRYVSLKEREKLKIGRDEQ